MSQSTFEDDDLFGEAANEMRADVEESLAAAWAALPDADAIWDVEAENTLGALNALRSALDAGDAEKHLRDAKKWYTMGERADAFEDSGTTAESRDGGGEAADADDLAAEIEELEETLENVASAREQVGEVTSTLPALRSTLQDAAADGGDADGEDED
jgi:hypothetical protein